MGSKRYSTKRIKASQLPTAPPPSQPTSSSPHIQTVTSQRTASTSLGLGYTPEGWVLEGRQPGCILNRKLSRDTLGHILIQDNLTVLRIPMSAERPIKEGTVREHGTSTGAAYKPAKTGGFESVMQNLKVSAMRSQESQGTSGSWSAPATAVGSFASDVRDGGRKDNQSKTALPVKEASKEKDVKAEGGAEGVEVQDFGSVVGEAKVTGKEKEKESSKLDKKKDVITGDNTTGASGLGRQTDAHSEQQGDKVEEAPAGAQNGDKKVVIVNEETADAKSEMEKDSKDQKVAESVHKINEPPSTEKEQAADTIQHNESDKIEKASEESKLDEQNISDTATKASKEKDATKANNEKDATEVRTAISNSKEDNQSATDAKDAAIVAPKETPPAEPEQEREDAKQAEQSINSEKKKPEIATASEDTAQEKSVASTTQQEETSIKDEKEGRKTTIENGQQIASGGD